MIIEWLLEISAGFLEWVGTLFPPIDLPDWVANPFFGLQEVVEAAAGWGVWVNVPLMAAAVGVTVAVYGVTATVKLVRALIAHVPVIGGNG